MPKVLRILNRFNLGGPTYNAAYLSKYLPEPYETMLIGGQKDESEGSSLHVTEQLGLNPLVLDNMKRSVNPKLDRQAYKQVRQIIRDYKPDIVHTHASKAGAVGRLAAIHENVPAIVHTFHGHVFHGYFNPLKTNIYKTVERYLASRSQAIVCISELQKEQIALQHKICPLEKVSVIPLGFDLDRFQENKSQKRQEFRSKYQINEDTLAIGIVGRLVPIKNHQMYLRGMAHLKGHSSKKVQGFIVGDGECREEIESLATELGLSFSAEPDPKADLIFTSWIKNMDDVFPGLDLVCLTSLNEGTPVSLIEAQAANKAIITTNVGGVENVVLPGQSALLCEVGDQEAFNRQLTELVEDDNKRDKMSRSGQQFAFDNFHYRRLVDNTVKLYDKLLGR